MALFYNIKQEILQLFVFKKKERARRIISSNKRRTSALFPETSLLCLAPNFPNFPIAGSTGKLKSTTAEKKIQPPL
jgi:hypothetical protein